MKPVYVYILACRDGSYYVGHAEDVSARVAAHNASRGAAYTARWRPVRLVYCEPHDTEALAVRRERQIKKWSRAKKQALITDALPQLRDLAHGRL